MDELLLGPSFESERQDFFLNSIIFICLGKSDSGSGVVAAINPIFEPAGGRKWRLNFPFYGSLNASLWLTLSFGGSVGLYVGLYTPFTTISTVIGCFHSTAPPDALLAIYINGLVLLKMTLTNVTRSCFSVFRRGIWVTRSHSLFLIGNLEP